MCNRRNRELSHDKMRNGDDCSEGEGVLSADSGRDGARDESGNFDDEWRRRNKDSSPSISGWKLRAQNESLKNSSPHSATMHLGCLRSKYGSRSLEMAIYPAKTSHTPGSATEISRKGSFCQYPGSRAALRKNSRGAEWPDFPNSAQKAARVEASKGMLRILQESDANQLEGIATGDASWCRYSSPSSKMVARSPAKVIPRARQAIGTKKTMITFFFIARKLIVLDDLSKWHKYNQQYVVNYIFPDLKQARPKFSLLDAGANFLDAHRKFNVWQWIQDDADIREGSRLPISAPTRFRRHKHMWLSAVWYVERNLEESGV
jgi:hypothetical protein